MQDSIKKQPKSVIRLRAAFLKLSSALEIPLLRINQAKSEDLASVSNYYSTELANYMRKVLQIIPATMFSVLARIIELQTKELKDIPARIEKDKLKDYAQFDQRYAVAKLTHSIAVFTEGILMMKKTLVGVLELDPKQLLEDGIRKELVRHLALAFHEGLTFLNRKQRDKLKHYSARQELESNLVALAQTMDGYRRSFAYIQDYLNVHGLKILQQELTRVINYNVEQECNAFLRNKIQYWQSKWHNATIPVPTFAAPTDADVHAENFVGRLAQHILECTAPQQYIYLPLKAAWYERNPPHNVALDVKFFFKLREAIAPAGLVGLDSLYAHMLCKEMKQNLQKIQHNLQHDELWLSALNALSTELETGNFAWETDITSTIPSASGSSANSSSSGASQADPVKYYAQYHERWLKVWPILCDWIVQLGQKQLLRQQLSNELHRGARCDCKHLQSSLETFNKAILFELQTVENDRKQDEDGENKIETEEFIQLLSGMRNYLFYNGAYKPNEQIFIATKNVAHFSLLLCLFTIAHVGKLHYNLPLPPKQAKSVIDGNVLLSGICCILQQFNVDVKLLYLSYLCQYANAVVEHNLNAKNELSLDAMHMLEYLEKFIVAAELPRTELEQRISEMVLTQWQYLGPATKN